VEIEIHNVMGIERAVLPLDAGGIALVAGVNAAGKSSLLECIAAGATANPDLRQLSKKDTPSIVRHGADAGSIILRWDGGQTRIVYPSGEVSTKGQPPLATPIGLGAQPLTALNRADGMKEITHRFKIEPGQQDMLKWLADRGTAISDKALTDLVARIGVSGWDAVHGKAREAATRDKGKWEAVSRVRWGAKVADGWMPETLVPGVVYDIAAETETLNQAVDQARIAREAVGVDRGRIESLREIAARGDVWRAKKAELQGAYDDLVRRVNANLNVRGTYIDAADAALSCPHCRKGVRLEPATDEFPRGHLVALPPLTGDAIQEARDKVTQLDEDRQILIDQRDEAQQSLRVAEVEVSAAERAAQNVAEMEAAPEATTDTRQAVERAEKLVREQRSLINAIEHMEQARAIHSRITLTLAIVEMLSPDKGVRTAVWKTRLAGINKILVDLSEGAGFDAIALTEDLSLTYADRPWNLLSESERWRCEFVMAVMMWEQERPGIPLLVDRLDVLHPQARGQALALLHARRVSAVIAMTARDPTSVPDLEAAGYGTRWWMTGGYLSQIHSA
jgi:hypothetical protein